MAEQTRDEDDDNDSAADGEDEQPHDNDQQEVLQVHPNIDAVHHNDAEATDADAHPQQAQANDPAVSNRGGLAQQKTQNPEDKHRMVPLIDTDNFGDGGAEDKVMLQDLLHASYALGYRTEASKARATTSSMTFPDSIPLVKTAAAEKEPLTNDLSNKPR
ncbi:hypothetical protein R1sor_005364 [Riccia sorocarpa]|uniref:Uncharacterized protein n=1 Tax=Riccia sorocarpa TaxID=122646 RepID=A0ABD3HJC2_9MARC